MRTLFTCLVVALVAALCFSQAPAGQTVSLDQLRVEATDVYTVVSGDTLYALEGAFSGNPNLWGRLVELNPFLSAKGRTWVDKKGRTIVLIRPGEKLLGLGELGIVQVQQPQPAPVIATPAPAPAPVSVPNHKWDWLGWLFLILFGLAILAAIVVALLRMRRNPVTAGPAMVPGGINDQTAAGQFRENASRATGTPIDRIEIRDLVRGRIYGAVNVRYRDGSQRRMLLAGQTGYRAMVRRNGGPWTEEYMLQACGNDLRMSGVRYVPGFGFRFVPEEAVEETPRPTPTQPEPVPTPAPARESEKHFTFRPAASGRPNMVDFEGFAAFEVEVKDGRTTVRFS